MINCTCERTTRVKWGVASPSHARENRMHRLAINFFSNSGRLRPAVCDGPFVVLLEQYAPTSRMMAISSVKMLSMLLRRLISWFRRSMGVERIWSRGSCETTSTRAHHSGLLPGALRRAESLITSLTPRTHALSDCVETLSRTARPRTAPPHHEHFAASSAFALTANITATDKILPPSRTFKVSTGTAMVPL
jgi:hypothetical protein